MWPSVVAVMSCATTDGRCVIVGWQEGQGVHTDPYLCLHNTDDFKDERTCVVCVCVLSFRSDRLGPAAAATATLVCS